MPLFADVPSRVADPGLRRAAELALRGRGLTAPNPAVGCVIVRDGAIVGEGFHARAGGPHAEIVALEAAGPAARGADVFVSLEPCRHHGRTGPCTEALIAAGVRRVVIGAPDPSAVAGGGARVLRSAGVEVEFAADPSPFEDLVRGWRTRTLSGRPFVTAKAGLSLDARVALRAGARASMTGDDGGRATAMLRAEADAVMVGAATVGVDDPQLTVRDELSSLLGRQPLRVVLSRTSVPASDCLLFADGNARTLLLVSDAAPRSELGRVPSRVEIVGYPSGAGVTGALCALADVGVNDLLVEPGPRLMAALWEADLVDRLVTVTAGGMAGADAPSVYDGPPDTRADNRGAGEVYGLALAHRFRPRDSAIVGDVVAVDWQRVTPVHRTLDAPATTGA